MSLPAFAARLCATMALRGATPAGPAVHDTPRDALALAEAADTPILALYSGAVALEVQGRDLIGADARASLTIQALLPPEVEIGSTRIDATSSGGELLFDLIGMKIERCLLLSDSPWAVLWREITYRIHDVEIRPYLLETATDVRVPCREWEIVFEPLASPEPGPVPDGFWATFLARMTASGGDLAALAPIITASITGEGAQPPVWRRAQAAQGLTRAGVDGIGIAPFDRTATGAAARFDLATIEGLKPDDVVIEPEPDPVTP